MSGRIQDGKLDAIQSALLSRLESMFSSLGVSLFRAGKAYVGPCPVHGGDNPGACNLYHGGHHAPGYWTCFTRFCERTYRPTVLGFVRGVLSHRAGRDVGFRRAVSWACEFLGVSLDEVSGDDAASERSRFAGAVDFLTARPTRNGGVGMTRREVRARLRPPAQYFIRRGFCAAVLDRYDVGSCEDPRRPFFGRAVAPVYDDDGRLAVGYSARSIHERCLACGCWHAPGAACALDAQQKRLAAKWRHSDGFARESHLYNWWSARKVVESTGVACLCEGPGDVWRLEEAGIHCGLALFGNRLTDEQSVLLETSGAMTLVVLLNDDEAGRQGADDLRAKLSRLYRLEFPSLPAKDLGEMKASDVRSLVLPIVEKRSR